jgi:phosphoribosylanthranilate isomerase
MSAPRTLIKICGITRTEDALAALHAGADWLGFIRWPGSPRWRPAEACRRVIEETRDRAGREFQAVGVYVDSDTDEFFEDIDRSGIDRLQLHGSETPDFLTRMQLPVVKTIRVRDAASLELADEYPDVTLLTDTEHPVLPGGTGQSYDPALIADLVARRRVMVAGGLHPGNVAGVVRFLRPYGVDVSSGVEVSPGIKDHQKIADFVAAVREGDGG